MKFKWLIRRSIHEAELKALSESWQLMNFDLQVRIRTLSDKCHTFNNLSTELRNELSASRAAQLSAERRFDSLQELHSSTVRVVTWNVDPMRLTAKLRAIESTLRAERDGDKLVVYSNSKLSEAQINAVNAVLLDPPNRT